MKKTLTIKNNVKQFISKSNICINIFCIKLKLILSQKLEQTHIVFFNNKAAICDPPCQNNGKCSGENKCSCVEGWLGNDCTECELNILLNMYFLLKILKYLFRCISL